ncbi:MAG: MoaD/ThiS family protein [Deltaproteobacteria bacterium]|nr:MoaD/ThiS family protein [Deltaproteobacteria bacterium]
MARVVLPTHLRSYTRGASEVEVEAATLGEALAAIEARHPGFRVRIIDEQDRIRRHIKCFVAGEQVMSLDAPLTGDVHITAALSGG